MIERKKTRKIFVRDVAIGGDAPITIWLLMTKKMLRL